MTGRHQQVHLPMEVRLEAAQQEEWARTACRVVQVLVVPAT